MPSTRYHEPLRVTTPSSWRATEAGGKALPLRDRLSETIAAHKLTILPDGKVAFISKETSATGALRRLTPIYPTKPLFAVLSPELESDDGNADGIRRLRTLALAYARMTWDVSPSNGQRYGGGEESEENQMLIKKPPTW